MTSFSESKIFDLDLIKTKVSIKVSIKYNLDEVLGIDISLADQFIEGSTNKKNEKVDPKVINALKTIWIALDDYFLEGNINNSEIFTQLNNLPVIPMNFTDFQMKCYRELCKTQMGQMLSYKQLGSKMKSIAYRAVGTTMKKNRFPILIPCHRVISNKGIGGYMGETSKLKRTDSLINTLDKRILDDEAISDAIKIKLILLNHENKQISTSKA